MSITVMAAVANTLLLPLMRINPHPLLSSLATSKVSRGTSRWYFFRQGEESAQGNIPGSVGVHFSDQRVLKRFNLGIFERWQGCILDPEFGLRGGQGELINSLVANRSGVSSPKLCAAYFDFLRGSLTLISEKLSHCSTLWQEIQAKDTSCHHALIANTFSLLLDTLRKGVYHADPNASNVMCSENHAQWYLIDFECVLAVNCELSLALALQAGSLWDWRIQPYVEHAPYRKWLEEFLAANFPVDATQDALKWFDQYSLTRPNKEARRQRLRIAGGGKSDIRSLIQR